MRHSPATLLVLALGWAPGVLSSPVRYEVAAPSKVTFEAASTLHGFHGGTEAVTGIVTYDPESPLESHGEVLIEAESLKTGDRKRDSGMRGEALEVDRYPRIKIAMRRFAPDPSGGPGAGNIHGELDLHGVTRKLLVPATVTPNPDGTLQVNGKVGIDMQDWGIQPPRTRVFLMTMRVLPNVTVGFDLTLRPDAGPAAGDAPAAVDPELQQRLDRLQALKERIQASD